MKLELEILESRDVPTTLGLGINGINNTGWIPPDPQVAVGPAQVLEIVNEQYAVYDKATGSLLKQDSLLNLFSGYDTNGIGVFDPQCLYDEATGKFVVAGAVRDAAGGLGYEDVAVSDSSDIASGGFSQRQQIAMPSGLWGDFPKLGMNADNYFISVDLFDFSNVYYNPAEVVMDKASLMPTTIQLSGTTVEGYQALDVIPVRMHGALSGGPEYFLESNYLGGSTVEVLSWDGSVFTTTVVPVVSYSPVVGAQPNGDYINTDDAFFLNAEWNNGVMAGTLNSSVLTGVVRVHGTGPHHAKYDYTYDSAVAWFEFSTEGTPSLVQQGVIHEAVGTSTYYGAITVDATGNIAIAYTQSSLNEYPSVYVDVFGTSLVLAVVGTGTIQGGRAGDYAGIAIDPTDGSFWVANEYGLAGQYWGSWVQQFSL